MLEFILEAAALRIQCCYRAKKGRYAYMLKKRAQMHQAEVQAEKVAGPAEPEAASVDQRLADVDGSTLHKLNIPNLTRPRSSDDVPQKLSSRARDQFEPVRC